MLGALATVGCRPSTPPAIPEPVVYSPVIPLPVETLLGADSWTPPESIVVSLSDPASPELRQLGQLAADISRGAFNRPATVSARAEPSPRGVSLRIVAAVAASGESYHLQINSSGVEITAPAGAGIFYGLQTYRQLVDAEPRRPGSSAPIVHAVTINDAPRFSYRGLHLDVGRHFSSPEFVKRYIDLMARYKLNTFHWHLTEDQGWRIEILGYPRLTSVGACRRETLVEKKTEPYVGDGVPYCGFYTQNEIRDVVAYAQARYVTIIPEIEMPGHSKAVLAAYPELACTPGPFEVRTIWGVDDDILCPSEQTFTFVEDVLDEVTKLFPGRFVHIGGDEAPKKRWHESALAQGVMKREGLKDEHELQSYFIRRVEQMLIKRGRRLIGWDEILEGGLAPEATVMSWRGSGGGIAAARQGHDVIMSPNSHLYLDAYQGNAAFEPLAIGGLIPLERVYSFEPIPDSLTADQAKHVLGAQGNVWTEYLPTAKSIEYMAYPRAIALAEVTWSPRASRNWDSFFARLPYALRSLDQLGVNYRLPTVDGLDADGVTLDDHATIRLHSPIPGAEIRYTIDGTDPTLTSEVYHAPFDIPVTAAGVRVTARAFMSNGHATAPRSSMIRRTTYRDAERLKAADVMPGLTYSYYEASLRSVRAIDSLRPVRGGVVAAVSLRGDERPERFAVRLSGVVRVPATAIYTFGLTSDDGSSLSIGDLVVVDNDGFHGAEERTGMIALRAGYHPLTIRLFQGGGGASLALRYRAGDGAWSPVTADWLGHQK